MNAHVEIAVAEQSRRLFAWNPDSETCIAELRRVWNLGWSTARIGRHFGTSKNAIVGKAHRLDLPSRPSPIKRGNYEPPRPRRVAPHAETLPPLPSQQRIQRTGELAPGVGTLPVLKGTSTPRLVVVRPPSPTPAPRVSAPLPPRPERIALPLTAKCRFPLWGEHERPTHQYCDAPAEAGSSWCGACRKVVFQKATGWLAA